MIQVEITDDAFAARRKGHEMGELNNSYPQKAKAV
ncbi:MAG: hypothetical protein CM15mV148_340 [uncultured marine virus]|nr:MAG: hypothetical protein CM15mV148_340 [uncultured marine virus]